MASLVKLCKISSQLLPKSGGYVYNIARYSAMRDYKPGPYPKTEEERAKAAEKYQLEREDYTPIPEDDGHGHGDYPQLPIVSADCKDDYYPWDYPELKRNFNEPMHIWANIYTEDRINTTKLPFSLTSMWLSLLGTLGGAAILIYVCEQYKIVHPVMPKQYPKAGETHYTFEPLK